MKTRMNLDVEGRKCARGVSTCGSRLVASKLWTPCETPWLGENHDRPCGFFSKRLGSAESVGIWKPEVVVGSRPLQFSHHNGLASASFKPTGICGKRRSPYHVAVRLMMMNSICCRILIQCVCYCTCCRFQMVFPCFRWFSNQATSQSPSFCGLLESIYITEKPKYFQWLGTTKNSCFKTVPNCFPKKSS